MGPTPTHPPRASFSPTAFEFWVRLGPTPCAPALPCSIIKAVVPLFLFNFKGGPTLGDLADAGWRFYLLLVIAVIAAASLPFVVSYFVLGTPWWWAA